MEKLLKRLFDLQRFENDPALRSVTDETEKRHFGEELTEEAVNTLYAAGDPFSQMPDPGRRNEPH